MSCSAWSACATYSAPASLVAERSGRLVQPGRPDGLRRDHGFGHPGPCAAHQHGLDGGSRLPDHPVPRPVPALALLPDPGHRSGEHPTGWTGDPGARASLQPGLPDALAADAPAPAGPGQGEPVRGSTDGVADGLPGGLPGASGLGRPGVDADRPGTAGRAEPAPRLSGGDAARR